MLTVKIELDQNKENYQAVLKALAEFDIVSASWEEEKPAPKVDTKLRVSGEANGDLGAALSQAIDRTRQKS